MYMYIYTHTHTHTHTRTRAHAPCVAGKPKPPGPGVVVSGRSVYGCVSVCVCGGGRKNVSDTARSFTCTCVSGREHQRESQQDRV